MAIFRIFGGVPLHGDVRVGGAKNAALPMMAAALLADGPVRLEGVPQLTDVEMLGRVLRALGMRVRWTNENRLCLETINARAVEAPYKYVRRLRAGFCVLGPLVARRGRAVVPLPGGCRIGDRPVDLHLAGLSALGMRWRLERGFIVAEAERLAGAEVDLAGPRGSTVTGTANVMSAAVLAEGITIIRGAAREPEIVDLGRFLNRLGARIDGLGTPEIRITGVPRLSGGTYRIIPDRIEAGTLLTAAAMTQGNVRVSGAIPEHLESVLEHLRQMGAEIVAEEKSIELRMTDRPLPLELEARPYPGVPTDLQAQLTALLSLARGTSRVTDTVFPQRFLHVPELNRLGGRLRRKNGSVVIEGVERFRGAAVQASDLRASAALVLAGLAARGETVIHAAQHLDRGYERLEEKLAWLGAGIVREKSICPQMVHVM
ncbi:MAG: UDP-N-acetylglucosamine 1-carboxyvinyltransferase [Pirellulales bacterium]|nr:UDP-N-acetylglucosamine 1-carboxyvinyltransferase [Pirellulales bacterium]